MQEPVLLILVVEDDSNSRHCPRSFRRRRLSNRDYGIRQEAITLLNSDAAKYRALLTDIHLTGKLTGWDVAKGASEINPEIPIVI